VIQDTEGRNRLTLKKQIVTDEAMKPVAVIIDYQDWQQIETVLQKYWQEQNAANNSDVSAALASYAGSITLTLDPLEYQQQERNAWL
jgi:glucokinase